MPSPLIVLPIFLTLLILPLIFVPNFIHQQFKRSSSSDRECATDTLFVLDSSGSVRRSYDHYRDYVEKIVQQMDIGPEDHRVALMVYSGRLRQFTKWAFDQPQEKEEILARVKGLPLLNGTTSTGVALDIATQRELAKRRNGPNRRANVVVLSDGFSFDSVDAAAKNLHDLTDVQSFAVGLDDVRLDSELLKIAGSPDRLFVGLNSTHDILHKLLECPKSAKNGAKENQTAASKENVIGQQEVSPAAEETYLKVPGEEEEKAAKLLRQGDQESNEHDQQEANSDVQGEIWGNASTALISKSGSTPSFGTTDRNCRIDLILVLDASGSLRQRFEHQKEMAAQLIDALPATEQGVRIGIVKFSGKGHSRVQLPLENQLSRTAIQKLLSSQTYFGGITFTNEALEKTLGQLEGPKERNIEQRNQLVAIFTDGMSQEDPAKGAKALQANGATVFAIAVEDGQPINAKELELIAGDQSRVFTNQTFDQLIRQVQQIAKYC